MEASIDFDSEMNQVFSWLSVHSVSVFQTICNNRLDCVIESAASMVIMLRLTWEYDEWEFPSPNWIKWKPKQNIIHASMHLLFYEILFLSDTFDAKLRRILSQWPKLATWINETNENEKVFFWPK